MTGFSETMRSMGHGIERVLHHAIDSRDDEHFCPDVPPNQRFEAVHDRHSDFINRVEREHAARTASDAANEARDEKVSREVSLGDAPSTSKETEKVPAVPTVLNNEPAQSPFANALRRSAEISREFRHELRKPRTSDEERRSAERRRSTGSRDSERSSQRHSSEGRDLATELPVSTVPGGASDYVGRLPPSSLVPISERTGSLRSQGSAPSRESLDRGGRGVSIEIGPPHPRAMRSAIAIGDVPRTESQSLGMLDEIHAGQHNRVIRRRVVLPYQITLIFGVASIVGVALGCGILVIGIRNASYLRGPKSGPQLPEIRNLITETLNATLAIGQRLGTR